MSNTILDTIYVATIEDHLNSEGFVFLDIAKCLVKNIRDGLEPIDEELEAKIRQFPLAPNAKNATTNMSDEIPF